MSNEHPRCGMSGWRTETTSPGSVGAPGELRIRGSGRYSWITRAEHLDVGMTFSPSRGVWIAPIVGGLDHRQSHQCARAEATLQPNPDESLRAILERCADGC
jgi:hypothetical protein